MWVQKASWSFDNADSLVESLNLEDITRSIVHDGSNVKTKVLWVKLSSELVWEAQFLSSSNLDVITSAGEITDDTSRGWSTLRESIQSSQVCTNDSESYGFGLIVGEFKKSLGRVVVDELHTKNLRLWEGGEDLDIQVGSDWVFEFLFDDLMMTLAMFII